MKNATKSARNHPRGKISHEAGDALDSLTLVRLPLHAKVRENLRDLALQHFDDGAKFYTEPELIERLGVSQGTVRRALGDLAREGLLVRKVPQGTFVCKPAPQPLTVGIFMPQYDSPFLMAVLEALSRASRQQKVGLRIYHTQQGENLVEALRKLTSPPSQERVVLLGETPSATRMLCANLWKRGYRIVSVDTLAPTDRCASLGVDNAAGIRLGMEHLLGLGHRRIALLVNEPAEIGNVRTRVEAFRAIVAQYRMQEARVFDCGTKLWEDSCMAARAKMDKVMVGPNRPTAIFAVSDPGAWTALQWLAERGIKVPAEVSVLGFDDDRPSQHVHPSLSTLRQPVKEMAQVVFQLLAAPIRPGQIQLLPPTLVIRKSTGRVPS